MNTAYAGEQLLSEIVVSMFEMFPGLDSNKVKTALSKVVSKYQVSVSEENRFASDLPEKIHLFLASKRVEGLSVNTLGGYRLELELFARRVSKRAEDITSADIRIFLGEHKHLKASTIGKKLNVLRSFFSFLMGEEMIQRDPTLKVKQPKKEKRLPKALKIEELEMLREKCQSTRQRAFLEIFYATGCRLSEIHQLNISDINFQNMSCKVIGKGDKERVVYFSFKAMYHLKKYLNERTDKDEALMVSQRKPHQRLSQKGIQREMNLIAKNAGLEHKVTPHVLRHTFATLTLNNGADLVAVQELLGHSSPETTLRYARITEDRKYEQHKKFLVQ